MIKWIISRLTMIRGDSALYDNIGKLNVYYYKDYYFDTYLASSRFGMRVKLEKDEQNNQTEENRC